MSAILYLFLACLGVQVSFLLLMRHAFGKYSSPSGKSDTAVSVIVCARDEAQNLRRLLPALMDQNHENFEIILVDDRSTDGTDDVCRPYQLNESFHYLRIDTVPENFNGKKFGLTKGIEAASNNLILLTDADCMPASNEWISEMCSGFSPQTDFVLGFGMYREEPGLLNLLIRFETLWTAIHYLGFALLNMPYMGVGRNLAYRKRVFSSNSGFSGVSHITGGDDDLLVNKLATGQNCEVVIGRKATTWSVPKRKWRDFFIQKIRHLSVGRHYSPASRMILGVISLSHIFGYIFMGILLLHPVYWVYAAAGLVIRTLLLLYTFKKACQKLEIPFSTGKILPMDLMYAIYYPVMGISASLRKKIRWN
ncbi:MAG: glycosyltransferase [Cyclobacteriaceae bacterium]